MPKYNIFKEMKAEWPLWFRIKFNIRTFPMHMKLKLSFLWCDVKTWIKQATCKHEYVISERVQLEGSTIETKFVCYKCGIK